MAASLEKTTGVEEMELREKAIVEKIDDASSGDGAPVPKQETSMNKAKWLACVALCLAYTTAYQQNSCTSAILKHIDEKLGMSHGES
jgi:hypothetical protein